MANEKQTVLIEEDGTRYVMGTQEVPFEGEVPCRMPVIHGCPACRFEWPDVLTPPEVKVMKAGKGCPECREGYNLIKGSHGDIEYRTVEEGAKK